MSDEEDTVSIGTLTCPACDHEHRITLSLERARDMSTMLLAAVGDLEPSFLPLRPKGGSDG